MERLNRKDVLLVVLLVVSCALFAISRPDESDVRSVVWNYSFILLFASTAVWMISEILSWLGSVVIGSDILYKINNGMSKNGLVLLAHNEGLGDRSELEALPEEDLIALLNNHHTKKNKAKGNMVLAVYLKIKGLIVGIVRALANRFALIRKLVDFVKGLFKKKKKKKK